MPHNDRPLVDPPLKCTFEQMYECMKNLPNKKITNLQTTRGIVFEAMAAESVEVGIFIQLPHNNRIYPCCWGNQTNHMGKDGQRIGQYSRPLDQWCNGMISKK